MNTGEQVYNAVMFTITCAIVAVVWHWLSESPGQGQPTRWVLFKAWARDRYLVTSSEEEESDQEEEEEAPLKAGISPAKRNDETGESSFATPKDEGSAAFPFPDVFTALARLINDGKLTEGDAFRIALKAPPGGSAKYKEARRQLTAALDELKPSRFLPLTEEQRQTREELGLPVE